jgi:hypothetical protein
LLSTRFPVFTVIPGRAASGANPESRGVVRYHIEIPGSSPSCRALRGPDRDAPE